MRRLSVITAVFLLAMAGVSNLPGSAAGLPDSGTVFAPYVYQGRSSRLDLVDAMQEADLRWFTLAFIKSSDRCQAAWSGRDPLDSPVADQIADDIDAVRNAGGDVIVSFGGAYGQELAAVCTSTAQLAAEYESVISRYDLTALDFDIEGGDESDRAANTRRAAAIVQLQNRYDLHISFTVETGRRGIGADALDMLRTAINTGVRINRINVMPMYFDARGESMLSLIKSSVDRSTTQLAALFPSFTAYELNQRIGITTLIGKNSKFAEQFTYADAVALRQWAEARNIGLLSMWSLDRDRDCRSLARLDPERCSGLAQDDYAYTHAFIG
jgi:hypothetical protein